MVTKIEELDKFGNNLPRYAATTPVEVPSCEVGNAVRIGYDFSDSVSLESLLYNKGSEYLVVSLHGALNRKTFELPRFERLATLLKREESGFFIADPSLYLDQTLELAWFTGWEGYNLFEDLAVLIENAASAVAAKKIVLSGSSGGGFAALQLAALIPGSIALVFNPQTDVHTYWQGGDPTKHGAVRKYIEVAYPSAAPDGIWKIDWSKDWSREFGTLHSPQRTYKNKVDSQVVYVNNANDFHVEQHYVPFLNVLQESGQEHILTTYTYDGAEGHFPPDPKTFNAGLDLALSVAS